jgi:hypothetical protein
MSEGYKHRTHLESLGYADGYQKGAADMQRAIMKRLRDGLKNGRSHWLHDLIKELKADRAALVSPEVPHD